jgi:hypothetical protein
MKTTNPEQKSAAIMSKCPRFNRCSVPVCPLDLLQDGRSRLRGEPLCGFSKARRHRIGKDAKLPRQGLTKREWAAYLRWQRLPESERRRRTAGLRPFRPVVHTDQSQKKRVVCPDALVKVASGKAGS